jgi:hypothetical protein
LKGRTEERRIDLLGFGGESGLRFKDSRKRQGREREKRRQNESAAIDFPANSFCHKIPSLVNGFDKSLRRLRNGRAGIAPFHDPTNTEYKKPVKKST